MRLSDLANTKSLVLNLSLGFTVFSVTLYLMP